MDQEVLSKDEFSEDYIAPEALEPFEYVGISDGGVMIKRVKTIWKSPTFSCPSGLRSLERVSFRGAEH